MDDWNAHHPLDISGWAFRDYLLRICQRSLPREDFEQLLTTELVTARDLVEKTPENDALWWFMYVYYSFLVKFTLNVLKIFQHYT